MTAKRRQGSTSQIDRFGQSILVVDVGPVRLPTTAPLARRNLCEYASFPIIADDDQVDSLDWLNMLGQSPCGEEADQVEQVPSAGLRERRLAQQKRSRSVLR